MAGGGVGAWWSPAASARGALSSCAVLRPPAGEQRTGREGPGVSGDRSQPAQGTAAVAPAAHVVGAPLLRALPLDALGGELRREVVLRRVGRGLGSGVIHP